MTLRLARRVVLEQSAVRFAREIMRADNVRVIEVIRVYVVDRLALDADAGRVAKEEYGGAARQVREHVVDRGKIVGADVVVKGAVELGQGVERQRRDRALPPRPAGGAGLPRGGGRRHRLGLLVHCVEARGSVEVAGVPVGVLDPLGDGDWSAMMLRNLDELVRVLSGE